MNKKVLSLVLTCLSLVGIVGWLSGCGESVDYIATVKSVKPFEDSAGITASYGTVLNKYISECKWQTRKQSKELVYVDASGKIKNADGVKTNIAITFKVTPYEGKTKGQYWIEVYIVETDGKGYRDEEATGFVGYLFDAYDKGYDSMVEYAEDNYQ